MRYWRAYPHQWGSGKTHIVHPDGDRTLCGKKLADCPGCYVTASTADCRGCLQVLAAEERRRAETERWQKEAAQHQREREAQEREWWRNYNAYLESAGWKERHDLVLEREKRICQGCRKRPATEVHHLSYRHVFHEPLYELVAICQECHKQLTEMDRNPFRQF